MAHASREPTNSMKFTPNEIRWLRRYGFHEGKAMRRTEVPTLVWKGVGHFVTKGAIIVTVEYGVAVARLTERGQVAARGRKPGPKNIGVWHETTYNAIYHPHADAHWSVKLLAQLMRENNMTFRQITKKCGISYPTMYHWMVDGKKPWVDKIEAVLGVFDYNLGTAWVEWEIRQHKEQEQAA